MPVKKRKSNNKVESDEDESLPPDRTKTQPHGKGVAGEQQEDEDKEVWAESGPTKIVKNLGAYRFILFGILLFVSQTIDRRF